MDVCEQLHCPVDVQHLHELLSVIDGGMQDLTWIDPPSVQVDPKEGWSIISIHNSIRVKHRYYLEDVVLPQDLRLSVVASQKFDDAFDNIAGIGLSRVDSGSDNNGFFLLVIIEVLTHLRTYLSVIWERKYIGSQRRLLEIWRFLYICLLSGLPHDTNPWINWLILCPLTCLIDIKLLLEHGSGGIRLLE